MEACVSFFYHQHAGRCILYNYHPSLALEKVRDELENIKYFFGEEAKVIISSEGYVDELVQQCDSLPYDGYVLKSDGCEVLNEAVERLRVGKLYLSKNVLKAYFKSRSREYDHQLHC
jgi:Response regulator containing a CheY-like receiver domain and an HTH DNA-binding domain